MFCFEYALYNLKYCLNIYYWYITTYTASVIHIQFLIGVHNSLENC